MFLCMPNPARLLRLEPQSQPNRDIIAARLTRRKPMSPDRWRLQPGYLRIRS